MALRYLIFKLILEPLIRANYALRDRGVLPDKWFWADLLALRWGFFVDTRKR